jgi:DNA-binding NarL/FixJ family response regulator
MEPIELRKIRILLAEPQASYRQFLLDLIKRVFADAVITRADTPEEVLDRLKPKGFDLCIIGQGIHQPEQLTLLRNCREQIPGSPCALVSVVHTTDNDTLLSYVYNGAHGLLLSPVSAESLAQVVTTALTAVKKQRAEPADTKERINSLPWILENFAMRLEDIAIRLRTAEQSGIAVEATPKLLKEVLLSTISVSGETDKKAVETVVRMLIKDRLS